MGFPNTDDFYPEASRRLGEKGVTTINVCVDGMGRVIGRPTINQSSGSARLDEGALRLAKAGSGHYRATTEDGRPVSACYGFRVRFQLRDYCRALRADRRLTYDSVAKVLASAQHNRI